MFEQVLIMSTEVSFLSLIGLKGLKKLVNFMTCDCLDLLAKIKIIVIFALKMNYNVYKIYLIETGIYKILIYCKLPTTFGGFHFYGAVSEIQNYYYHFDMKIHVHRFMAQNFTTYRWNVC